MRYYEWVHVSEVWMRGCVVVVVGVAVGVWRACACLFCPLKKNGACPEGFGVRWTEVMDLMNTVLGVDENTDTRSRTSEVRASLLASLLYILSFRIFSSAFCPSRGWRELQLRAYDTGCPRGKRR